MKTNFLTHPLSVPVIVGTDIRDDVIHLHAKEILELENQKGGIHLTVLSGTAWVTQPGDPDDHFLQANETMDIQKNGLVLVQAMPEATLRW
jgi:hypothetical protein